MKREIKFRCFTTYENKMHYADVSHFISINDDGSINNASGLGITHVMQFTGLKDKNGNPIYEYDRVFDPYAPKDERELFTVRYDNDMARFILAGEGDAEWDETDWQIYDNIYEKRETKIIYD